MQLAGLGQSSPVAGEGCALTAALLARAGTALAAEGEVVRGRACTLKALHLMVRLSTQDDSPRLPSYAPQVSALLDELAPLALPPETNLLLGDYYERAGAYAQAEKAILSALEAEPSNPSYLAAGRGLYRRLLGQNDAALASGGLPRAAVEAGLKDLLARAAAVDASGQGEGA